jgi:hypothetical protein
MPLTLWSCCSALQGTGLGDGDTKGAKDISDQIKDEDQLLGAEQKKEPGAKKEEHEQDQGGPEEENKVRQGREKGEGKVPVT